MKKYLKIARIDHWIKQLFIVPGMVEYFFCGNEYNEPEHEAVYYLFRKGH
jgi:hypothetical protein